MTDSNGSDYNNIANWLQQHLNSLDIFWQLQKSMSNCSALLLILCHDTILDSYGASH